MATSRMALVAAAGLGLAACQVVPDTGEKSGPKFTVTLVDRLHNQSWNGDQKVFHGDVTVTVETPLDILATLTAKDPGGMETLDTTVIFFANACDNSGTPTGGTSINTLDVSNQTAHPHPPGTIIDTLFYLHDYTTAELKKTPCNSLFTPSSGKGTVQLLSRATNPSHRATDISVSIHTKGGVTPND
jgi:hypothetical protein